MRNSQEVSEDRLAAIRGRVADAATFASRMSTCFHHVPFGDACTDCGRPGDPYSADGDIPWLLERLS